MAQEIDAEAPASTPPATRQSRRNGVIAAGVAAVVLLASPPIMETYAQRKVREYAAITQRVEETLVPIVLEGGDITKDKRFEHGIELVTDSERFFAKYGFTNGNVEQRVTMFNAYGVLRDLQRSAQLLADGAQEIITATREYSSSKTRPKA